MDAVQKAYRQIADLFRTMTPAARITTGLLLGVILVSLLFLFRQRTEIADEYLFGGEVLTQSEISAIEAAFSEAKLNKWEVVGNRVRVPRSQKYSYLLAVSEKKAFPETPVTPFQEMFLNDSPLKSRQIRELQAQRALERALAVTIQRMTGIDAASVLISEIDQGGFPGRRDRQAVVSVKTKGNESLDSRRVEAIRNMVAYGGGVKAENVTIADLNTGQAFPGTGRDGRVADNLYVKHQREFEEQLKAKVVDRLAMYPGVKVAVHVVLDRKMVSQTVSNKYDQKPTTVEQTEYSKETTSTRPESGGRPGIVPNAGIGNLPQQVTSVASAQDSTTERKENQKSLTGATQTVIEEVPFAPTNMWVSIGIPTSYFERLWRQMNPAQPGQPPRSPDPNELQAIEAKIVRDIEEAVKPLLPMVAQGEDPDSRVKVIPYTETPLPALEEPGLAETAVGWLASNWQTIGMFLLAAAAVLVLQGMIRSARADATGVAAREPLPVQRLAELDTPEQNEDKSDITNSLRARFQASGRSLRDELTELVREDPDAAAGVLQHWIGDIA